MTNFVNRPRRLVLSGLSALALSAGTLFATGVASPAQADGHAFPEKDISYIIPFGPGGESDITARFQQEAFPDMFGKQLVISYKPGGGGAVGWSQLNDQPADGYTVMGMNLPHIIVKPMEKEVGFKTEDLKIAYIFHYTPDALVVRGDSEFQSLQDLIDFAKENPGKTTLSGSGKASANHLAQVSFDKLAGVQTTYIPFKGTGASVTALKGNQVTAAWGYSTVAAKHPDTRLLAVAMEERHPNFPDVPTFKELGFDMVSGAYRGVAVPTATPDKIVQKLSDMIGQINADPAFQKKMIDGGFALTDISHDKVDAFMEERRKEYEAAAKAAGII